MHALSWQWGPFTIYGYGLILGLLFLIGTWIGTPGAARVGLDRRAWWRYATATTAGAIVGARLIYVLPDLSYYVEAPWRFFSPPVQGLSYYGGVFFASLSVYWISRRTRIPFWRLANVGALPWAFALVMAAVLRGAPGNLGALPLWTSIVVNIFYFTGAYFILWRVWLANRDGDGGTAPLLMVLGFDALLRFFLGLLTVSFHAMAFPPVWISLLLRGIIASFCLGLLYVTRDQLGGWRVLARPFYRPLSRWFGWLVAYGVLFVLMIVSNAK